jgi:hypothetical protein
VLAIIVIGSVVVKHEITFKMNFKVLTLLPLLFVIVPVTVIVYVPVSYGLDHDITLVVVSNVINDVLCVLSAVIAAE